VLPDELLVGYPQRCEKKCREVHKKACGGRWILGKSDLLQNPDLGVDGLTDADSTKRSLNGKNRIDRVEVPRDSLTSRGGLALFVRYLRARSARSSNPSLAGFLRRGHEPAHGLLRYHQGG
jgi:hypothetical protein